MTTVGFGDSMPRADLGRTIASRMMLLGWGGGTTRARQRAEAAPPADGGPQRDGWRASTSVSAALRSRSGWRRNSAT